MKSTKQVFIALMGFVLFGTSCSNNDDPSPEQEVPEFEQINDYAKKYTSGVVEVSNYLTDTTRKRVFYDYFNFDKAEFVTPDATNSNWHITFERLYNIFPNNGDETLAYYFEEKPWFMNSASRIVLAGIAQDFDEVAAVPDGLDYGEPYAIYASTAEGHKPLVNCWAYQYTDAETGRITYTEPLAEKTFIIKLDDGRYVKFQFVNIYENEAKDNSITSTSGYLSFRYFISESGSTNVNTQ